MNKIIFLIMSMSDIIMLLRVFFILFVIAVLGLILIVLHRYFTRTKEFNVEGEILSMKADKVPIIMPRNLQENEQISYPLSLNKIYFIHQYLLKVKTGAGILLINLEKEIFEQIKEKKARGEKHVNIQCKQTMWNKEINAKKILAEA